MMKMKVMLIALAMVALAVSANAALVTSSDTAPDVDGLDIANFTGTSLDKWFFYPGEWASRPVGQSFTPGTDGLLNAITYEIADTQKCAPVKDYTIRVCTVNKPDPGDSSTWSLTEIYSETGTQGEGTEWIGTTKAADMGVEPSPFMTWTLESSVALTAGTEYGVDVGMNSSTTGWQTGIPYLKYSQDDEYADGTRYHTGHFPTQPEILSGVGNETMVNTSGDRVFHLDIVPEPATICLLGLGGLSLLRRRKRA